jgi:flagellar biosynthesis/type III secretory pathway protein FliH
MSWSRYEPPIERRVALEHVDVFDRPAANGPHPWTLGHQAPDPAPALAAELAALREQARSEGMAAALAEARAIAAAEVETDRARWAAGLDALVRQTLEVADARRTELAELAIAIAEAVLQTELERGRAIETLVAAGMGALGSDEDVTLVLSPVDCERVAEGLRARWSQLTVRSDTSLPGGALRLESPAGRLSTSIGERLARARALVLGVPSEEDAP